jgi:hypothetical protein
MLKAKIIKGAQRSTGKVAQFRMVALRFEFTDNGDWNNYFMLFKSRNRTGICQKY